MRWSKGFAVLAIFPKIPQYNNLLVEQEVTVIQVLLEPPEELRRPYRSFTNAGKSKHNRKIDTKGDDVRRYWFALEFGRVKAVLEALEEIPCVVFVRITADDSAWSTEGTIIVWKDSHLEIGREAVAEIDRLAERAMRRYGGSCSFLLSWDREITLQEVER